MTTDHRGDAPDAVVASPTVDDLDRLEPSPHGHAAVPLRLSLSWACHDWSASTLSRRQRGAAGAAAAGLCEPRRPVQLTFFSARAIPSPPVRTSSSWLSWAIRRGPGTTMPWTRRASRGRSTARSSPPARRARALRGRGESQKHRRLRTPLVASMIDDMAGTTHQFQPVEGAQKAVGKPSTSSAAC